jgi:hypothetical protein
MSDEDAYMALALCNAQGELHPLEEGMHALHAKAEHGIDLKVYADKIGKNEKTLHTKVRAARVADNLDIEIDVRSCWSQLAELHPAPRWLWRSLVSRLVAEGWAARVAASVTDIGDADLRPSASREEEAPLETQRAALWRPFSHCHWNSSTIARFAGLCEL